MNPSHAAVLAHLEWMRQRGLSPVTITYRRRLLAHLSGHLGVPLLEARPAHLATWRASLTVSPATVTHYVSHAASFYRWALKQRLVKTDPTVDIPVPAVPKGQPRPISEADLMRAVDAAPPRIRLWLILAAWCGLRAKEVAYLRAEDIMAQAVPPVLLVSALAAKGGRPRVIPLAPFVLAELAAADLPARGWAFTRRDGKDGPNQPWVISQITGEHLHRCGIPHSLHSLRHRFGTSAYRASRDLRAVQSLMGHADPATTAGYAAFAAEAEMAAVAGIPVPGGAR